MAGWVWMRVGDQGEYERYDFPDAAGDALGSILSTIGVTESEIYAPKWRDMGLSVGPYRGDNYVSVYWGDKDAQPLAYMKHKGRFNQDDKANFETGLVDGWRESAGLADNPKSEADSVAARELVLFIKNDYQLYRQQHTPIIKNLMRKRKKGIFDKEKAVKLFEYLTEAGAKKYLKEFSVGERTSDVFTKATRRLAAQELTDSFVTEAELGNYDEMDLRIGHNPAPYDPGNTGERSGVERAAYDQGYLGPTGGTGHSMDEPASSPDELGQPEVDSMTGEMMKLKSNPATIGQRVELHPATDAWMQGDRFGTIVGIGRRKKSSLGYSPGLIHVKMDRSGKIRKFHASNVMPMQSNPHERQVPPQGSFTTENLTPGFLAGESFGHEGRPGGLEPLPQEARLNPVPLHAGNEPGELPKLNPLTLGGGPDDGGPSGVTVEPSGSALPAPRGETFGGSVLKDKDGEMPKLNPVHTSGDLVYVESHAQADALNIPAGPNREWRDSQTSAVVNRKTGEIRAVEWGHTFTYHPKVHLGGVYVPASPKYGDVVFYAASDEAARLLRDARYTVKFRLVEKTAHYRPVRGVKGNPMDLSSFGGRHLGASGHTLDTSGSANVDEGKGRSEMPKLNPHGGGMSCPHCQKVVSGGIGKPGEYTCSGCGGKLVLVRG